MTDNQTAPLNFTSKKKKKPKNPLSIETPPAETEAAASKPPELAEPTKKATKARVVDAVAPAPVVQEATVVPMGVTEVTEQLNELAFGEKKKKKKGALRPLGEADLQLAGLRAQSARPATAPTTDTDGGREVETIGTSAVDGVAPPTTGYPYEMLLARVFAQIQANNPELMPDMKRRLVMAPPCMARVGTKKTHFTNFNGICRSLNREPSHLSAYLFAELGTTGSVDANGALLIRGKYQAKHIEPLLRNYARTYVLCSTCQSPKTKLSRDSRLLFLQCEMCGSRVTVKNVTSGFQAVTGKRAAIRAKTQ